MLTSVEDMIRHFAERPVREEKPEPRAEEIPHLPEHDFVSFLAVCHQKIRDRNAFASVEKEFHVGFESINDLFDRNAGEIPSYQQLMIEIRTLLLGAGGDRHSICRLRGIQTALFWRGLSLQVNIRELLAVMHIDRQTAGVDALSLAIRQQVDPVPAAIAALTYVTALDPGDVAKLRKGNVEHDVSRIEFNGILWDVPEQIRAPIAMCRDRYATNGHTGNTRLVLKNGEPFTERDIEMALWHFSQETGCYISPGQMHHEPTEKISHRLIDKHLDLVALDGTSGLV